MTESANAATEEENQRELFQCLAELLYLKRVIETQIMINDAEKAVQLMDELLMNRPTSKGDKLILKYYIKALQRFDKF